MVFRIWEYQLTMMLGRICRVLYKTGVAILFPPFFLFFFFWIVHILTQGIDINEFLPEATFNWCRTQLLEMAFDPIHPPKIPGVEHSTPFHTIYLQFREIVSTHIASDADPVLELSKAPQRPTSMTSWAARD